MSKIEKIETPDEPFEIIFYKELTKFIDEKFSEKLTAPQIIGVMEIVKRNIIEDTE